MADHWALWDPGGPLEVLALLHRGRDRAVLRVREGPLGQSEVLKLLAPGAGAEARRALSEEFLLLDRIRHPHLVRVRRFIHFPDGSCGYLMEDLPSPPPSNTASPGWGPRDLEAVRGILGALAGLHAIGFAHLDLKPSQILGGERGVCLIDLGLAASFGESLAARGTWGFIAPEILAGEAWDARADLYGLGCLIVQVWTGESPLGKGEVADQMRRQRERPRLRLRERVEGIPEGLDRVVEGLLDPDPGKRPAAATRAWESLHTMSASRERYLERRRLPVPEELPFVGPEGVEEAWDAAVQGGADREWVIEGPIGSGRRRLLARLRARAEVLGAECSVEERGLTVRSPAGELGCRIGKPRAGERVVELGAAGQEQARVALLAYGLEAEGGEEGWTRILLQLRIEERLGGEEARRKSSRMRRAIAAAQGAGLTPEERRVAALALAACVPEEAPGVDDAGVLVDAGCFRADRMGRLEPAAPPWDRDALEALVGAEELRGGHHVLLKRGTQDAHVAVRHALGDRDRESIRRFTVPAVEELRKQGAVAECLQVLGGASERLGQSTPHEWMAQRISLALEHGSPAWCLPLLRTEMPLVPNDWRVLLEAHLDNRSRRRKEALAKAEPLIGRGADARMILIAGLLTVRALQGLGELDQAVDTALALVPRLCEAPPGPDQIRMASALLDVLSTQEKSRQGYEVADSICLRYLNSQSAQERELAATSLGYLDFRTGSFESAGRYFDVAAKAAAESGDARRISQAKSNLAGVWFEQGRLVESEALNRESLAGYIQLGDGSGAAYVRRNLAAILHSMGQLAEALDLCRSAEAVFLENGEIGELDSALGLEATILVTSGLDGTAEGVIAETMEGLSRRPQPSVEALLLRGRGTLAWRRGQSEEALSCWRSSIDAGSSVGAADEVARTLLEWAAAECALRRFDRATEILERVERDRSAMGGGELDVLYFFTSAMLCSVVALDPDMIRASELLEMAAVKSAGCGLRLRTWRCHAALAGVRASMGDRQAALHSIHEARDALRDFLNVVGDPVLQEHLVLLPDVRSFLTWCDSGASGAPTAPPASSDLSVFLI